MSHPIFTTEPYASLLKGPRKVLWHELPALTGFSASQLASLMEPGVDLFPRGGCDPKIGRVVWNRKKVVAWRWAVHQKNWLSDAVAYWLGRDRED